MPSMLRRALLASILLLATGLIPVSGAQVTSWPSELIWNVPSRV